jgi:hypothetical protein
VDLVHPGQVLAWLEIEELLEPAAVMMNTLWVVPDMKRQVPPAVVASFTTTADRIGTAALRLRDVDAPGGDGTGPQATGGEVPVGPRAQVRLDQVCDLIVAHVIHA